MRRYLKILIFVAPFVLVVGCEKEKRAKPNAYVRELTKLHAKDIVLIRLDKLDRCGIAKMIEDITRCNAKVIGMNAMFREFKEPICDNNLARSIKASNRVVLVDGYDDGEPNFSIRRFLDAAMSHGPPAFLDNEGEGAITHYFIKDTPGKDGSAPTSFAATIALTFLDNNHDLERVDAKIKRYEEFEFTVYQKLNQFIQINSTEDISKMCSLIENKIVLIGPFGGPEYTQQLKAYQFDGSIRETDDTVIHANMILNIFIEVHR